MRNIWRVLAELPQTRPSPSPSSRDPLKGIFNAAECNISLSSIATKWSFWFIIKLSCWHTVIFCTISGSNCTIFSSNTLEKLNIFLDLGRGLSLNSKYSSSHKLTLLSLRTQKNCGNWLPQIFGVYSAVKTEEGTPWHIQREEVLS